MEEEPRISTPVLELDDANKLDAELLKSVGDVNASDEIHWNLLKCMEIRNKYLRLSCQMPGDNPKDSLDWCFEPPLAEEGATLSGQWELKTPSSGKTFSLPVYDLSKVKIPGPSEKFFRMDDDGVYRVYHDIQAPISEALFNVPSIKEYYEDNDLIISFISDGPTKTFCFRRLRYLEAQFQVYTLMSDQRELAQQKQVPHRDFYNVRKVDTHVHHSSSMNCKHLLRFIKSKLKKHGKDVVIFRDNQFLTLEQVFTSLKLTAYDLSIDTLDMHAHKDSFHRFDNFNLKYNPIGESRLREIFLKTDNLVHGRYLAELTKELISDLEASKYQLAEYRLSIYGKSMDEWDKLAAWVCDNQLFSNNVRWIIQIPRLYYVYKHSGSMSDFEQLVRNVFQPLFEVSHDPSSHPKLHIFLKHVSGFDSVDDESKVERRIHKKFPLPRYWNSQYNPPYSYYIYYLYANMCSLNKFRQSRGFNTFVLRPHSGEAGDTDHLTSAFLTSYGISHGILLRKVPALQYLFYLMQIPIALSPLSNNALFLAFERNPFPQYFQRGLNVSLSTDDPLQFHYTKEPLIEEYSVASQIWKFSACDMCEISKNSVLQSGFERALKLKWLGKIGGVDSKDIIQDIQKTNVPDIRVKYREETLNNELNLVNGNAAQQLQRRPTM